jgi:hypothetical protein
MRITSTGLVGIGTNNPNSLLHVNSNTTSSTIRLTNSATSSLGLWLQSDNLQSYFLNYENTPMKFATNGTDKMIITAGGNVGIGTNVPTSTLEVNGDVEIPSANDYTYSTAKTNYVSVSASAFTPIDGLTFDGTGTGNARWITGGTPGNANVMYAPINLPDGASISEFEIFYNDQDAVYAVSGEIEGLTLSTNSIFDIATTPTSTAGVGSVTDNTISHIVNNASIAYFLKFNTYEANSDLWIRGAVITYTVTKAD